MALPLNAYSATQLRFLTGTKSQTFNTSAQEQVGTSPLGLLVLADFSLTQKVYLSFGSSFELSTASFSTSGFSLYGSALYYFRGRPNAVVTTDGTETYMELYQKYSFYGGIGIFQKEIRLRNSDTDQTDDESLGGLLISLGGNCNLNPKFYLNGHIQLLNSGRVGREFNSTEFYFGLGLRI
jgi:hypothetical protein